MQLSGTFPQLSDNTAKRVRKQVKLQSATATQRGGAIGGSIRRHAGSMSANRARARARAKDRG